MLSNVNNSLFSVYKLNVFLIYCYVSVPEAIAGTICFCRNTKEKVKQGVKYRANRCYPFDNNIGYENL